MNDDLKVVIDDIDAKLRAILRMVAAAKLHTDVTEINNAFELINLELIEVDAKVQDVVIKTLN